MQLPAADRPRRGLPPGAGARRADLRRLALSRRSPTTRPRPGRPVVPPPSQLALIKWRDVVTGPDQVLEDVTPPPGREDPDRLGARRQPVGDAATAQLTFDPTGFPTPAGLIRAGARARRAVHALGLAARDLPRRLPGQAARRPGPPGARPPRPGRRRRVPAADPGARGARRRRRQGRPRRRERPAAASTRPSRTTTRSSSSGP